MAKRDYQNDYPSVTEILSVLRKIGLEMWFKHNTAQFCDEKSRKGREIGKQIHEAIQSYIETGKASIETEYESEVTTALKSFIKFTKENPQRKLYRSEIALTSESWKFNGTIDCIGDEIMYDWKTCEAKDNDCPKVWDEWKYQISAYVQLYNEVNKTNINKAVIVAIAKDKEAYSICEMDSTEIHNCFYEVFLPCLSIVSYQRKQKERNKNGTATA